MRHFLALLILGLAQAAMAADIRDCETWEANARNLWLPPSDGVRSYSNGRVTLIHLDTGGEPVCCSSHLMVLHPAGDGEPWQACTLISHHEGLGFAALALPGAEAGYDPAHGLTIEVPGQLYLLEESFQNPVLLRVTVNQATGTVTAETRLGPE